MSHIRQSRTARRAVATVASVGVATLALSGCFSSGPTPVSGYQEVEKAVGLMIGQGTFIEPGTLEPREGAWVGTGEFLTPDGLLITNNHVVAGTGTLQVQLGGTGGATYNATVLGTSECNDIAVVQVNTNGQEMPFLTWREGDIPNGLPVWVGGFPSDYTEGNVYTLAQGTITKNNVPEHMYASSVDHAVEHDVRTRPGNSGSAIVDEQGRIVAIHHAGDSNGFGFGIHRDQVLPLIPKLKAGELIGSIGINAQAWVNDGATLGGVWAQSVVAGGPADKTGVRPGDLVLKLGGVTLGTDGTLKSYCDVIESQGENSTIDIQVFRPSTNEVLEGQINGRELVVTQSGGGSTDDDVIDSSGFVDITNDSGQIKLRVPAEWRVNGEGYTSDDGRDWLSLVAAPDLNRFLNDPSASGVQVLGTEATLSAQEASTGFSNFYDSSCSSVEANSEYADGYYTGVISQWDCNGAVSLLIAANNPDVTHTVVVFAQLNGNFETSTVWENIYKSFLVSL